MDGLVPDGRGSYLVSDFNGRLFRITREGLMTELLNTTASGAFCADLAYLSEQDLLIVPGLYDIRLTAFRFGGI